MKLDKIDNKSRRLRKKLFLGEFAILGFDISFELNVNDMDAYDSFLDGFLAMLEARELCFGGGGMGVFEGFVCPEKRYGSTTEEDKAAVINWLESQSLVSNVEAGEMIDANYGE